MMLKRCGCFIALILTVLAISGSAVRRDKKTENKKAWYKKDKKDKAHSELSLHTSSSRAHSELSLQTSSSRISVRDDSHAPINTPVGRGPSPPLAATPGGLKSNGASPALWGTPSPPQCVSQSRIEPQTVAHEHAPGKDREPTNIERWLTAFCERAPLNFNLVSKVSRNVEVGEEAPAISEALAESALSHYLDAEGVETPDMTHPTYCVTCLSRGICKSYRISVYYWITSRLVLSTLIKTEFIQDGSVEITPYFDTFRLLPAAYFQLPTRDVDEPSGCAIHGPVSAKSITGEEDIIEL